MKLDHSYELHFHSLKVGTHAFDWQIGPEFLQERGVEAFSDVNLKVALTLERKERILNLDFDIKGTLTTLCDRCGEPVEVNHGTEDHLVVRFSHETDMTDDEVVFLDENEQSLEVGQFIYEFIMVGQPSRFVHAEGECDPAVERFLEELPEEEKETEENKEIDPRWEALKKLKQ